MIKLTFWERVFGSSFWTQTDRLQRIWGLGIALAHQKSLVLKVIPAHDYWIAFTFLKWYVRIGIAVPNRDQDLMSKRVQDTPLPQ